MDTHTFNLTQKLKTFGAIDLKHFHINDGIVNEHYLIVANTVDNGADPASNAVIYHFNQGHFIPMQILNFETEIKQFLPVVVSLDRCNRFILKFFRFLFGLICILDRDQRVCASYFE